MSSIFWIGLGIGGLHAYIGIGYIFYSLLYNDKLKWIGWTPDKGESELGAIFWPITFVLAAITASLTVQVKWFQFLATVPRRLKTRVEARRERISIPVAKVIEGTK